MAIDYDPEQRCHVASLILRQLPPPDFALTLGECIHNLRGALEFVTWQLALKNKGREPSRKEAQQISFPISDKPEWFSGASVFPHVSKEAAQELALHQPYAERLGGPHDPALLTNLREMSNEDKHRLIIVSTHAMNLQTADIRWVNPLAKSLRTEPIDFEEGRPILPPFPFRVAVERMITEPPEVAVHTEFNVKKQPESRIFFDGSGQRLHLRKLDALADCIEFIVGRFERFV
ncbi:MAG: hypothetical protein ACRDPE_21200 [Solirubrobacterales bacterium]